MSDLFYSNADSPHFPRRVWRAAFIDTRLRMVEIEQKGRGEDQWNVSEISLLLHGLPQLPERVDADAAPNAGDAHFAVDGSEATRWRSWAPMRPGMKVEIRYPVAVTADEIDVDCGEGQWDSRMQVRGQGEDRRWIEPISQTWVAMPASDQRKSATAELKREAIYYVLISKGAWRVAQFTTHPEEWGLSKVFSEPDATLYRIE
jgi:hypothetical protein